MTGCETILGAQAQEQLQPRGHRRQRIRSLFQQVTIEARVFTRQDGDLHLLCVTQGRMSKGITEGSHHQRCLSVSLQSDKREETHKILLNLSPKGDRYLRALVCPILVNPPKGIEAPLCVLLLPALQPQVMRL